MAVFVFFFLCWGCPINKRPSWDSNSSNWPQDKSFLHCTASYCFHPLLVSVWRQGLERLPIMCSQTRSLDSPLSYSNLFFSLWLNIQSASGATVSLRSVYVWIYFYLVYLYFILLEWEVLCLISSENSSKILLFWTSN